MSLSNLCISLAGGVLFVGLFYHLPFAVGVRRAFSVQTKLDCIRAGNHPDFLGADITIPVPPTSQVLPAPSKFEPAPTAGPSQENAIHKF